MFHTPGKVLAFVELWAIAVYETYVDYVVGSAHIGANTDVNTDILQEDENASHIRVRTYPDMYG